MTTLTDLVGCYVKHFGSRILMSERPPERITRTTALRLRGVYREMIVGFNDESD
ncbi:hypothetical protein [Gordonia sputi]|uniref:hypothetical protein n=1 Tax=Gordonia sputi TaxID=36823 RepID=UPI00226EA779|nr:hypothetical protein [Gordonia sputi]